MFFSKTGSYQKFIIRTFYGCKIISTKKNGPTKNFHQKCGRKYFWLQNQFLETGSYQKLSNLFWLKIISGSTNISSRTDSYQKFSSNFLVENFLFLKNHFLENRFLPKMFIKFFLVVNFYGCK